MAGNQLQRSNALAALGHIVRFAQVDFDAITVKDFLGTAHELQQFMDRHQPPAARGSNPLSARLTREQLQYVQQRTLELLREIAERRAVSLSAGDLVLTFLVCQDPRRGIVVGVIGSPLDVLLYQTVRVLEDAGAEKLHTCPALLPGGTETCGRLFVRVTKKEYCSPRCQSRMNMRTLRARKRKSQYWWKDKSHGKTTRPR